MKKSEVRLTQLASAAGCGAKIGPKVLAQVVGKLPKFTDPMLLVGPETSDDAAVYKINDELAMIHTVDFFPPVVDDPYMYGQIAAANALSDVYAMGGVPKLALNVVAFPNCLGPEVLDMCIRTKCGKITAQKKETSLFLPNRWAVESLTLPLRQKWRLRKKLREFRKSWRS